MNTVNQHSQISSVIPSDGGLGRTDCCEEQSRAALSIRCATLIALDRKYWVPVTARDALRQPHRASVMRADNDMPRTLFLDAESRTLSLKRTGAAVLMPLQQEPLSIFIPHQIPMRSRALPQQPSPTCHLDPSPTLFLSSLFVVPEQQATRRSLDARGTSLVGAEDDPTPTTPTPQPTASAATPSAAPSWNTGPSAFPASEDSCPQSPVLRLQPWISSGVECQPRWPPSAACQAVNQMGPQGRIAPTRVALVPVSRQMRARELGALKSSLAAFPPALVHLDV
ncbi:hypothetical protein TOPH_04081 [Tolypocladium ophioglossoides CBS 100239]|uniref:Uncharacterized protein n=1 Tax=Tolypocladium ophioglossoides (strain CBS 100239) TaxID=1163406 RepID=A0A0L0NAL8_TOLOC|nr:hypothetical protein TOPH_04081 [Tolypocladium ophioglossoides CBS 100239]